MSKRSVANLGQKIEPHMINCSLKFDNTTLSIKDPAGRHIVTQLIKIFQDFGKWKNFTLESLPEAICKQDGFHEQFHILVEDGWIIHRQDGFYAISPKLIQECYIASVIGTSEIPRSEELKVSLSAAAA